MATVFYEMIGRLFSRKQTRRLGGLLESSGLDMVPEQFAGAIVLLCVVASLLAYAGGILRNP